MSDERYDRSADMRLLELQRQALGVPRRVIESISYSDPDPLTDVAKDEDETYVQSGTILIAATDARPRTDLIPGALVTVSLSVANDGDVAATAVRMSLPLPVDTSYRPGTLAIDGVLGTDDVAAELFGNGVVLGDIDPGARSSLSVKLVVESGSTDILLSPQLSAASGAIIGLRAMRLTRAGSAVLFERPFYESDEDEHALEPLAPAPPQATITVLQPPEFPMPPPAPMQQPALSKPVTIGKSVAPVAAKPTVPVTAKPTAPVAPKPPVPTAAKPPAPIAARPPVPAAAKPALHVTPKPAVPVELKPVAPVAIQPSAPEAITKPVAPVAAKPLPVIAAKPAVPRPVAPKAALPTAKQSSSAVTAKAVTAKAVAKHAVETIAAPKPSRAKPKPKAKGKAQLQVVEPAPRPKIEVVRSVDDRISFAAQGGPILAVRIDRKRLATLTGLFSGTSLGMVAHYLVLNALAARDPLPGDGTDESIAAFVASQEQLLSRALITTRLGKTPASDSVGAALPAFPPALAMHAGRRAIDTPPAGQIMLFRAFEPTEVAFVQRILSNEKAAPFMRAAQLFIGLCANDAALADETERRRVTVALTAYAALATAEISRIFLNGKNSGMPDLFKSTESGFDEAARTVLAALARSMQ